MTTKMDSDQVKAYIEPTLNLLAVIKEKYYEIEEKSELLVDFDILRAPLTDAVAICYVYMGVSTAQSMELFEKMNQGLISSPAMLAVSKSFMLNQNEVENYLSSYNLLLAKFGYNYKQAITFHQDCWRKAKDRRPNEMEKLEGIRNSDWWSWINEKSWKKLEI